MLEFVSAITPERPYEKVSKSGIPLKVHICLNSCVLYCCLQFSSATRILYLLQFVLPFAWFYHNENCIIALILLLSDIARDFYRVLERVARVPCIETRMIFVRWNGQAATSPETEIIASFMLVIIFRPHHSPHPPRTNIAFELFPSFRNGTQWIQLRTPNSKSHRNKSAQTFPPWFSIVVNNSLPRCLAECCVLCERLTTYNYYRIITHTFALHCGCYCVAFHIHK